MSDHMVSRTIPNGGPFDETARNSWVMACWADMKRLQSAGQSFATEDYLTTASSDPNLVVDLAYGEYGLRKAAGEAVDPKEFIKRFPSLAAELERQFTMEEYLSSGDEGLVSVDGQQEGREFEAISNPRIPERIGRYVILETLASGGQAVVYRGLHPELKIEVAVKVPRCESGNSEAGLDELIAEGRTLATLRHPNIARVLDLDRFDEGSFLVSEYISGRTLEQFLTDQPVTPREAAEIIAKIARGLAVAHRHGVVHLDIKPRNIMMDDQGEPRLIDFGLSIRRNIRVDSLAQWSGIRGTIQFMPPEQASGQSDDVGPRADTYALGGVLYYLLTRQFPYGEGTWQEIYWKAMRGEWRRDALKQPQIPRGLQKICLQAMAPELDQRFATTDEMVTALERFLRPRATSRRRFLIGSSLAMAGSLFVWNARPHSDSPTAQPTDADPAPSVASNLLEIEVWNDGRYLQLADVAPLQSGDRLRISATIPSNHYGSLFLLTSEGRWELLEQLSPEFSNPRSAARQFRFPREENTAVPLNGAAGTEVVILCSRHDSPVELTDLAGGSESIDPWPHLPNMTVLHADSQGVAVLQQGRGFGEPVVTPDPESAVKANLEALRARAEQRFQFTAVAFYRE